MRKISSETLKNLDDLREKLETEKDAYESLLAEAAEEIGALVEKFNGLIQEQHDRATAIASDIETIICDITAEMDEYYEDRSEDWQDSRKGEAYSEWKEVWEGVETEIDAPPELEVPELELPDGLDALINDLDEVVHNNEEPTE